MSYVRVFNDFKRRFINGEVEPSFDCSAYLMNSNYEKIYDNLQYMRSIDDFSTLNSQALYHGPNGISGNAIASGAIIKNDYYREFEDYSEDNDFTSDPVFVTSANSATYMHYAASTTHRQHVMEHYINTFGGFFLVSKIDEFNKMCSIIEKSNSERYAVVLADNIENIIINDALFNKTRQHPFRGVFDGNGYALQIEKMFVNDRTCGIFGYIADEGIVRNLIVQPAKIKGVNSINVVSTSKISLDTIKSGKGDVRFGILAGSNEGFCENVVVSGDISFYGRWRPNIYFTHNKYVDDTMDSVSLYCPEWESAPSYNVESVSALSSFTNMCFPTQLCINSEANLIPYVGYFGEAAFSHTVERANKLAKPLYDFPMSGVLYEDEDKNKITTFCHDIVSLYSGYCDDYNKAKGNNSNTYTEVHTGRNIMQRGTFRLGPNHRASYLIGGLFGLNNGCINNVSYSGTMEFNNCTVALIGGIAGRQARGTSHGAIGNVSISITSAAFADSVNVQLPAKSYYYERVVSLPLSSVVQPNQSIFGELSIISDNDDSQEDYICYVSEVDQGSKRFLPAHQFKSSYVGELSAVSDDLSTNYTFYACKIDSVSSVKAVNNSDPEKITVNCTAIPDGKIDLMPYSFSIANAYLRIDNIAANIQTAYVVTHDTNVYQSVKDDKTTSDIQLVTDLSEIYINLSGSLSNSSVYCTLAANISSTNLQNYFAYAYDGTKVSATEATNFSIKMPPIFHVGGYCGEYVITDRYLRSDYAEDYTENTSESSATPFSTLDSQLITDMSNCGGFAYIANIPSSADVPLASAIRQYVDYNTIAGFAACISLDTMNKSDCDTISKYLYTSATQLHYKNFSAVNFDAKKAEHYYLNINQVFAEPAKFVRYFYYTQDMIPAVVMAASHGKKHSEGKTYEPNFGITWLDQLFYGSGLDDINDEDNKADSCVAYWMKDNEWTDQYINSVAQAGYSTNANSASEQNIVYYDKKALLSNFIKFDNKASEKVIISSYVPIQEKYKSINTPYQYSNGRAGYCSAMYDDKFFPRVSAYSFDTSLQTSDLAYYTPTTTVAYFSPDINSDKIATVVQNIENNQPFGDSQSYIFTYSSTIVHNNIPPVKLKLAYTSAYSLENIRFPHYVDEYVDEYIAKEATQKCYAATSDSYSTIMNANTLPQLFTFSAADNEPLTSNNLVYGFIPATADIVKCLNQDPYAHLYCSGVSANDLQYLLVVDNKLRPIFDMKLDVDSVENQGYSVAFPKAYYHRGVNAIYCGGMSINIKTGN